MAARLYLHGAFAAASFSAFIGNRLKLRESGVQQELTRYGTDREFRAVLLEPNQCLSRRFSI